MRVHHCTCIHLLKGGSTLYFDFRIFIAALNLYSPDAPSLMFSFQDSALVWDFRFRRCWARSTSRHWVSRRCTTWATVSTNSTGGNDLCAPCVRPSVSVLPFCPTWRHQQSPCECGGAIVRAARPADPTVPFRCPRLAELHGTRFRPHHSTHFLVFRCRWIAANSSTCSSSSVRPVIPRPCSRPPTALTASDE